MADLRQLLEMGGGGGGEKPNSLIEAYLRLTQQQPAEQELGGPRAPPYAPPDDDQNRYQPQTSESFPVTLPRPTPEAVDIEDVGMPPPLRGADAQPTQGQLPPPVQAMLEQTPDIGTPESISLKNRPGILEGMDYSSDLSVSPGRDSGEMRLEGYESARGGTQGRSRWKDPSTYIGIADRIAGGWAGPGPGGGFGEGWALEAGNERQQQEAAAMEPYQHRQLEAETRQAESKADLAGFEAEGYTEQAQLKREKDEVQLEYTKTLAKNMEQVTRSSVQQMGIESGQLPMKQLEVLARIAKTMTEEELLKKRMQVLGKERTPEEQDKIQAEIDAIKALGKQREASAGLSRYRTESYFPERLEQQGRERPTAKTKPPYPHGIVLSKERAISEATKRFTSLGKIRDTEGLQKSLDIIDEYFDPMIDQSKAYFGLSGAEAAGSGASTRDKIFSEMDLDQ